MRILIQLLKGGKSPGDTFSLFHRLEEMESVEICPEAGLTSHPEVFSSVRSALEQFGSGTSSSRLLGGTTSLHKELEEKLAKFLDKEACLLFTSGFTYSSLYTVQS